MTKRLCSVENCPVVAACKGYCRMHYMRWHRNGDPLKGSISHDPWERFLTHIEVQPNGCWLWTAFRDKKGYGRYNGTSAHKYSYEYKYGPVPKGLVLDHYVCDTPPCANYDHVHPTTHLDNIWRSGKCPSYLHSIKTHCIRGHELSGDNIWIYDATSNSGARRVCKKCTALRKLKSGIGRS